MRLDQLTLSNNDKVSFLSNLSTMLSSSIPILESVDTLLEDSKGNTQKLLSVLRDDLIAGKRINITFAKFPKIFNPVMINLIKASEESGTLETTLRDIKQDIQRETEFNDSIKSALMYPVIIMTVLVGVLLMILIVVIPKIATVFTRLRVTLPLPTRIMIAVSTFLTTKFVFVLFGLAVIGIICIFLYKEKKQAFVSAIASLPLFSGIFRKIDLTRFARSLHLLLSSGLPLTNALELVENVVIQRQIGRLIAKSKDMLIDGKPFSAGFKTNKKLIPSMMIKLIEVGEKSGTLDKSMNDVSDYLDYQVNKDLKTITTLIEPIMLILVAVSVGGMMVSIIGPIYGLISQVTLKH